MKAHQDSALGTHVMVRISSKVSLEKIFTDRFRFSLQVVGIVCQLLAMVAFCILIFDFYVKARKDPNHTSKTGKDQARIRRLVFGIFFGSGWILLR